MRNSAGSTTEIGTRTGGLTRSQRRTRYLAVTAMLSAVATVLMYIEIAVPFMPSFIKLDLSDLPALLGSFAMGPVYGLVIGIVKNLIHLMASGSGGIGELSNALMCACFVLPAGLIYQRHKTKKGAIIGALTGAVVMAALSVPINYFIVYPVYTTFMPMETIVRTYQVINPAIKDGDLLSCLLIFNLPFTFFKAILSLVVTFLIYKPLSPLIHGTARG